MAWRGKWQGAWKNSNSEYAHSKAMDKDSLEAVPGRFKLVIKRNKFHKAGAKTPAYCFCFCDCDEDSYSNVLSSADLNSVRNGEIEGLVDELKELVDEADGLNQYIETYPNGNYCEEIFLFQRDMMHCLAAMYQKLESIKENLKG